MAAEALLSTIKNQKPVVPPAVNNNTPIKAAPPTNMAGQNVKLGNGQTYTMQSASSGNSNAPLLKNATMGAKETVTKGNPLNSPTPTVGIAKETTKTVADLDKQARLEQEAYIEKQMADQNKIATDYGLKKGASTIQEVVTKFKSEQEAAKTATQQEMARRDALDRAEAEKFNEQAKGSIAATNTSFAQNREGAVAGGAAALKNEFTESMNKEIQNNKIRLESAQAQRNDLLRQLDQAQTSGNDQLVESISKQLSNAEMAIQKSKTDYTNALALANQQTLTTVKSLTESGVLQGASPQDLEKIAAQYGVDPTVLNAAAKTVQAQATTDAQKVASERMASAVNTFMTLNTGGVPITPEIIQSTAQATGVQAPFLQAVAAGYNTTVNAIQADKNLAPEERQVKLDKAKQDLADQVNGLTTTAAQNTAFLTKLINQGASPETIAAFKLAAFGSPDYDDPLTAAKLQYQYAQTDDARQQVYIDAINNGLDPGAVLAPSSGSGYKTYINPDTGKYDIAGAKPGQKGGQCGHFVNQVFGKGVMVDSYDDKLKACDPEVGFGEGQTPPTPGMAFVMPVTGESAPYGHTGIYLEPDPKNPKNALVKDSNWRSDEKILVHSIPFADITGWAVPPKAIVSTGAGVSGLTNKQILENADAMGEKFKNIEEQNKYIAAVKNQGFLPGQGAPEKGLPPEYNWAGTVLENTFGGAEGGKAVARKKADLAQAIASGDGKSAKNIVYNALLENVTAGERTAFEDALTLDSSYGKLDSALSEFEKAGMDTGLVGNSISEIYKKLSLERPQEAVKLKTRLDQAFNSYRKAITGAGASVGELEMLKDSMPTFDKNLGEIREMTDLIKSDAAENIDRKVGILSKGAFESYSDMNSQLNGLKNLGAKDQTQDFTKQFLDFGRSLVDDHHAATGQYIVPEEHALTKYEF